MQHQRPTPLLQAPLQARLQAFLAQLATAPERHDFYQALRRLEALTPQLPRLGEALRPADEPLRVGQPPDLDFAPAPIKAFRCEGAPPQLLQRILGLLGPNGPLPTHLTALAHERSLHHGDDTLWRFIDLFTHRFALLFYRAWAQAQPALGLDRPGDDAFARRLGSLFGIGLDALRERDALGDAAKLHFTGRLARQVRDADGLRQWCASVFGVPVRVEPWCAHWLALEPGQRTRLRQHHRGDPAQALGRGATLGRAVWDVQHKFRLVIGPLGLARYRDFLPGGAELARLQALVRQWVGLEFAWELQLVLAHAEVPPLGLGHRGQWLGRSAWLGRRRRADDANELAMDVERTLTDTRRRRDTRSSA